MSSFTPCSEKKALGEVHILLSEPSDGHTKAQEAKFIRATYKRSTLEKRFPRLTETVGRESDFHYNSKCGLIGVDEALKILNGQDHETCEDPEADANGATDDETKKALSKLRATLSSPESWNNALSECMTLMSNKWKKSPALRNKARWIQAGKVAYHIDAMDTYGTRIKRIIYPQSERDAFEALSGAPSRVYFGPLAKSTDASKESDTKARDDATSPDGEQDSGTAASAAQGIGLAS